MRLLKKDEINQKKAETQRIEIEQGKSLAKRVDRLREVAVEEERSLELFRERTIAKINEEIKESADKRDALLVEVKELEDRKKTALEPLEREISLLEEKQKELKDTEDSIESKIQTLNKLIERSNKASEEAQSTISHIETMRLRAEEKLKEADSLHKNSKEINESIVAERLKLENDILLEEKRFAERLEMLDNREERISAIEAQLEKDRQSLLEDRIRLDDRSATLERAFNRLKK